MKSCTKEKKKKVFVGKAEMKNKEDKDKVTGIKNLLKMRKYFKGLKGYIWGMIVLDIIVFAIQVVIPLVMAQVLVYFTDFNMDKIVYFITIWLALSIVKRILGRSAGMCSNRWISLSSYKLKNDFIEKYLSVQSRRLDKQNSGIITTRFISDCNVISSTYNSVINDFIGIISGFVYVFIAVWVNWYVAIYLLVEALLNFTLNNFVINKDAEYRLKSKELGEKVAGINNETIRGWKDIKALGLKNAVLQRTFDASWEQTDYTIKKNDKVGWMRAVIGIFLTIIDVGFYILCAYLILKGKLDLASFLILYLYAGRILGALNKWTYLKKDITMGEVSAKRVFELFETNEYPIEEWGNREIKCKEDIKFSNVSFSYDDKKQVLKKLSFIVKSNQLIAFVGESGIGKSTILNLLTKNYLPTKGNIYIDNVNIKSLSEDCLRNIISYVQQSPYIFNMSIKENLKLVKPDASDEDIELVCKKAKLNDFIETLPDKYDSMLGENGVILSGGQKQRLSIARALLKDSKIILFDEATSALDNITQNEIKVVLDELKNDHTIIVVTHRLSTIIDADKIMLIKDGKISAEGTHKELLEKSKDYAELYGFEN